MLNFEPCRVLRELRLTVVGQIHLFMGKEATPFNPLNEGMYLLVNVTAGLRGWCRETQDVPLIANARSVHKFSTTVYLSAASP